MNAKMTGTFLLIALVLSFYHCGGQKSIGHDAKARSMLDNVPVLCYHQIRDWMSTDSRNARAYITPVATFRDHIQMLHDSGYYTILPDQLLASFVNGRRLPSKPVLITFDDGTGSQYSVARPALEKAGYKAVFFIMTVTLNKPLYMTREMVKDLAAHGHIIGGHTWDHHDVTKYTEADWNLQLKRPMAELAHITGSPVRYFAYPFGAWNSAAIPYLKQNGIAAAFQLWGRIDGDQPVYSIRRILVDGQWSAQRLSQEIKRRY